MFGGVRGFMNIRYVLLFTYTMVLYLSTYAMNEKLRDELIKMMDADLKIRQTISEETEKIDAEHTQRLKEIVTQYGWPDHSIVGKQGAHAAWLLAQHSEDLNFQKQCLTLMEKALKQQLIAPADYAFLYDRIAMRENKPQRYGSQTSMVDSRLVMYKLEDESRVDEYRKSVGLNSLKEYMCMLQKMYPK